MSTKHKIMILIGIICLLTMGGCSLFSGKETAPPLTMPGFTEPVLIPTASDESISVNPTLPSFPAQPALTEREGYEGILNRANELIAAMDDRTLFLQLMILYPELLDLGNPVLEAQTPNLKEYPVGGVLFRSQNVESREQMQSLIKGFQAASPISLLICVEEEGGRAVTTMKKLNLSHISNMFSYRGDGRARAYSNAQTIASDIRGIGFNTDFAPVADVWSDTEIKTIGERAYSDAFDKAAVLVWEAVQGFSSQNVICTLKHFPGMGEAVKEKKAVIGTLEKDIQALRQGEFLPFKAGIRAGADMVMIGHIKAPLLDENALAPFSKRIVTDYLRQELGFEGVIITDELWGLLPEADMNAGEACVRALQAGCDMLLCPVTDGEELEECLETLLTALQVERINRSDLVASVRRVLIMKGLHGLLEGNYVPSTPSASPQGE